MDTSMKIGIVGAGNVGCACAMAATIRGSAREIVLINRTRKRAEAVATDIRYCTPLGAKVDIIDGDYDALEGAVLIQIYAGLKEQLSFPTRRSSDLNSTYPCAAREALTLRPFAIN